jgi:hypothetical protein
MSTQTVAVLGASPKSDRYSNRAVRMLLKAGHRVIPINPVHSQIEGLSTVATLGDLPRPIDTLTVYVNPRRGEELVDQIVVLKPSRVILNPGTESPAIQKRLAEAGIQTITGCTLVMLSTEQF